MRGKVVIALVGFVMCWSSPAISTINPNADVPIKIPMNQRAVSLFKNNQGDYIISTKAIPPEDAEEAKAKFGIEELGRFFIIYDQDTDAFILVPRK
ncbi:MAG: hypothetical protein COX30_04060 [Candidatus Moranbacteria bacterium CG23_combo_of_CG06-09_8_20_14_all_39_10]|nr:MAG: hypothetical protein COX30_04060 [Candidatus Moranbacteria bacterium CG23_combo_of_CG06-09_8_20_14_all_39_10]